MIRTIFKAGYKLIILIAFTIVFALFASKMVRPASYSEIDNTKNKVDGFYALQDNSIDVLVLGTSHAYSAINPGILYHYTGLNSYDFAGQCQPMEVTYNYLVEALKTQDPKLVILDLFALSNEASKCQVDGAYRTNIQDLKASENKYDAYSYIDDHSQLENLFDISLYSYRLNDIDFNDYDNILDHKSDYFFGHTIIYPNSDVIWEREAPVSTESILPDSRRYESLLKIIDLCKTNNIELLLIKTPYYMEQEDANIYRSIWDLCEQNDIDYIDFNYLTNEMNYIYELDGDAWHANETGAFKITKYISDFITNNYDFDNEDKIYDSNYRDLYFEALQVMFIKNNSYDRLMEYINTYDVTAIIYDKYNHYSSDNQIVVYTKDYYYYDRFIIYNDNETEVAYDNSVYYNHNQIIGPNNNYQFVIIDNESGQVVCTINADELERNE